MTFHLPLLTISIRLDYEWSLDAIFSPPEVTAMQDAGDFQKHTQFQQSFSLCAIMVRKNAGNVVIIGYQYKLQLHVFYVILCNYFDINKFPYGIEMSSTKVLCAALWNRTNCTCSCSSQHYLFSWWHSTYFLTWTLKIYMAKWSTKRIFVWFEDEVLNANFHTQDCT